MEEQKKPTPLKAAKEEAPKMIPADVANAQMENLVKQANQRIQQLSMQVSNLQDLVSDKIMDYLFKVLKHSIQFDTEFVDKCADSIQKYLTKVIDSPEQGNHTEEEKEKESDKKE